MSAQPPTYKSADVATYSGTQQQDATVNVSRDTFHRSFLLLPLPLIPSTLEYASISPVPVSQLLLKRPFCRRGPVQTMTGISGGNFTTFSSSADAFRCKDIVVCVYSLQFPGCRKSRSMSNTVPSARTGIHTVPRSRRRRCERTKKYCA